MRQVHSEISLLDFPHFMGVLLPVQYLQNGAGLEMKSNISSIDSAL